MYEDYTEYLPFIQIERTYCVIKVSRLIPIFDYKNAYCCFINDESTYYRCDCDDWVKKLPIPRNISTHADARDHDHIHSESQTNYDLNEGIKVKHTKGKEAISFNFERNSLFLKLNLFTGFKSVSFSVACILRVIFYPRYLSLYHLLMYILN